MSGWTERPEYKAEGRAMIYAFLIFAFAILTGALIKYQADFLAGCSTCVVLAVIISFWKELHKNRAAAENDE
jgi:hypothetical protein